MTKDEALKLALEALEVANSCVDGYYIPKGKTHLPEIELAIRAIKEALANEALEKMAENARELGLDYEPEPEPYCYTYTENGEEYFAPPTAYVPDNATPLYTTPPQRTWAGLTDGDIAEIYNQKDWDIHTNWDYERAIEAKLKEKNDG